MKFIVKGYAELPNKEFPYLSSSFFYADEVATRRNTDGLGFTSVIETWKGSKLINTRTRTIK